MQTKKRLLRTSVTDSGEELVKVGRSLAEILAPGDVVYLEGELGAGKTTLCRGILQGLGYRDRVKSPTFALMETYVLAHCTVLHCDFYRLAGPDDSLTYLGLGEALTEGAICLIEWPEQVRIHLPDPNYLIALYGQSSTRTLNLFQCRR